MMVPIRSPKHWLILTLGILACVFGMQAIDSFFTPEEVKAGVIQKGMPYDLAKRVLNANGAMEWNMKHSSWFVTGPAWSLWSLPDGTTVLLTANRPTNSELTCNSFCIHPPGVNPTSSNGQYRYEETLTLADYQHPWLKRWVLPLYLIGCLGTGIYLLLNRETWRSRILVFLVTCVVLLPYLRLSYPEQVKSVFDVVF